MLPTTFGIRTRRAILTANNDAAERQFDQEYICDTSVLVTSANLNVASRRGSRSRCRSSAKQCQNRLRRQSCDDHMSAYWHCKRHGTGVVSGRMQAFLVPTRTVDDSAYVPSVKRLISYKTGCDLVP